MTLMTWPNLISLIRVPLAAAFVASDSIPARVGVAVAAGLSDLADGWLARSKGWTSRSGELLDPLTDRLFVVAALGSFLVAGKLQLYELGVLLGRDIFTAVAFASASAGKLPVRFRSRPSGKLVTTFQVATVLMLLLRPEWKSFLVAATGVAGVCAIVDYTRAGIRELRSAPAGQRAAGPERS